MSHIYNISAPPSLYICLSDCVSYLLTDLFVLQAQQLSAMRLEHDLMKKCEDQMLKQIEEMLCQRSVLGKHLVGWSLNQYLFLIYWLYIMSYIVFSVFRFEINLFVPPFYWVSEELHLFASSRSSWSYCSITSSCKSISVGCCSHHSYFYTRPK